MRTHYYNTSLELEHSVADLLATNPALTSYNILPANSLQDFSIPAIVINCSKLVMELPSEYYYTADLQVGIITHIDDDNDPLAKHDIIYAELQALMADTSAVMAELNTNEHLFVHHFYAADIETAREDRHLKTVLSYVFHVQNKTP